MDTLNRHQAPFPASLWERIDAAAVAAARSQVSARCFLEVDGPFGLGLTAVEVGGGDVLPRGEGEGAKAVVGAAVAVPLLWHGFSLPLRGPAAWAGNGQPLDLRPVEEAARMVARLEERLVWYGDEARGLAGLFSGRGTTEVSGGDWLDGERALDDVLAAVTALDDCGCRGPYALAAGPRLFNSLWRPLAGSDVLLAEHLARICARGLYKAPIDGAAVVDPKAGKLVVGQDLKAGYAGSDGLLARLFLTESLVLRLDDALAVCRVVFGAEL